ncbi:Protein CutA [Morus notabilis]|uniref:Protein CutA n=1 Tax=Morus notabilis TaxID=981085 RepID=W9SDS0_9ROSA|nr:protein CutA, chloroplastic [Morus notabilis]XP_010110646.1 protein CutA, chloroplastic [Morus notabilis]EXB91536.1 Protein CutA [Morus notabilis]EXC27421.1 Protein CutA [Morus notabilis]
MASALCCRARSVSSPILSSARIRRRLPLVGAFCVISLGLSNLCPSLSFKTGCAQSLPFVPLFKSKFSSQSQAKSSGSIRMASESNTVPSIVVYVTVPNKEEGKKLAESLVREKLAACVNRVPGIESVYQWQGEVQTDAEELLIIKTRESLLEALKEHVKANHPYDVPEVIALPITGGSTAYLEWLKNSTRD